MTIALTKFQAFGIEADEAITKEFTQIIRLVGTAANTDSYWDMANLSGTFWGQVDDTVLGASAKTAVADILLRTSHNIAFSGLKNYSQAFGREVGYFDSSPSAGGGATELLTITGMHPSFQLLGVSQKTDGAGAGVGIIAYGNPAVNQLSVTWDADPGAGAVVRAAVSKSTLAANAYQSYYASDAVFLPELTFLSGSAPTTFDMTFLLKLKDGEVPVKLALG